MLITYLFRKDWSENTEDFLEKLNFESIEKFLEEIKTVKIKEDGLVYAVVNSENEHAFYMIDNTKKK